MSEVEPIQEQEENAKEIAEEELENVAGGCNKEYYYPEQKGQMICVNWAPICPNAHGLICCDDCFGCESKDVSEGIRYFCSGRHKRK